MGAGVAPTDTRLGNIFNKVVNNAPLLISVFSLALFLPFLKDLAVHSRPQRGHAPMPSRENPSSPSRRDDSRGSECFLA